jgi:hypothetical protein
LVLNKITALKSPISDKSIAEFVEIKKETVAAKLSTKKMLRLAGCWT